MLTFERILCLQGKSVRQCVVPGARQQSKWLAIGRMSSQLEMTNCNRKISIVPLIFVVSRVHSSALRHCYSTKYVSVMIHKQHTVSSISQ